MALDILYNKTIIVYTALLLGLSLSVFNLENDVSKGLLTLLNVLLIIVPLMSILFSTIYLYNSNEFIEVLVSQPLKRSVIWLSLYGGLSFSLLLSFFIGIGIPVLIYAWNETGFIMLLMGVFLTLTFISLSFLAAVYTRDKAKGIGVVIIIWLFFTLLYDGILLFIIFRFSEYPLERIMIVFSSLNPVDLSRILVMLKMDASAMMGYTGAVFNKMFGSTLGICIISVTMVLWCLVPLLISLRKFKHKDL